MASNILEKANHNLTKKNLIFILFSFNKYLNSTYYVLDIF